ncbi:MAG: glycosyltransferase family 2 protein [Ktedonobacteraceae bacterium]|nr:glycosyltransferase family 2 protein [Ktedonobacteraceae bacterium]
MTIAMLTVSAIICAYTEARWLDLIAAVESLRQQSLQPQEIILVIDHNQRLLERAREEFLDVLVIENSEAQGLSGARNSGIAVACASLIAFLDDDATAEREWLAQFKDCFENPNVLGVGGTVEPEWLSRQPAWFPSEFYWVLGCTYLTRRIDRVMLANRNAKNLTASIDSSVVSLTPYQAHTIPWLL